MSLSEPLANLLRPKDLNEYAGQQHLIGKSGPVRLLCENNQLCSMILWGPPGCGKTSLVHVLEHYWQLPIINVSAINSGIKDIKAIVASQNNGLFSEQKIVFVDEIHRFNKVQQDAFLPYVEKGHIILIGATTENPAFSINNALLSRMRVFTLKRLDENDLSHLFTRALQFLHNQMNTKLECSNDTKNLFIKLCNGDARRLLSNLEIASNLVKQFSDIEQQKRSHNDTSDVQNTLPSLEITKEIVEQASGEQIGSFDKQGDHYYDILSAFHKSVRGSSVDGSLYWFARLLIASTDIVPICRRLLAIASEDIGNADPKALQICLNAWDIYHRVGAKEGERAIAQAVIYCALAPKSNAVYMAFSEVKRIAQASANAPVPIHLRNSTSHITKELGHGKEYQYAHNYEYAFAPEQSYLPEQVTQRNIYQPEDRGFEKQLRQKIAFLASLQKNKSEE